jgi:hypothetical protein
MMKISAVMWQTYASWGSSSQTSSRKSLSALQSSSARTCNPIKRHSVVVVVVAFAKAKRHQTMRLIHQ